MNHIKTTVFFTLLSLLSAIPAFSDTHSVRVRTFASMEPYGRMSVENWLSPGQIERWNAAYGFTPGIEVYAALGEKVELGAGFRYQVARRVLRGGSAADDEKFSYLPVYAAGRFDILDTDGLDMYGIVRLGYSFLTGNQSFMDIWIDDAGALTDLGGGFYAGASLGVILNMLEKQGWGLDWSMDAGYSYHGGSGRNSGGKGYRIAYSTLSVDFSLDWRF